MPPTATSTPPRSGHGRPPICPCPFVRRRRAPLPPFARRRRQRRARSAVVFAPKVFSSAATRSIGWPLQYSPSASFSNASCWTSVHGSTLAAAPGRRRIVGSRPPSAAPPNSCACPRSRSRWRRAPCSQARSIVAISRARKRRRGSSTSPCASRWHERVERAGLHQALQHALVDQPQIELIAQHVQRRDRPLRRAHAEDRRDRALAHVLDGRQAEAHAFRRHGERELAPVDVGRQHGNAAVACTPADTSPACRCSATRSSAAPRRSATGSSP